MKKYIFTSIMFFGITAFAQNCTNSITIKLENLRGGIYANQTITLTSRSTGDQFQQKSNASGEAKFELPCKDVFDITVTNYVGKKMMATEEGGVVMTRSLIYEPDMAAKQKAFAMNASEKKHVDDLASLLPDTTHVILSKMPLPKSANDFTFLTLQVRDLNGKPLVNESVCLRGMKRKKIFSGFTDKSGKMIFYLPKGDIYAVDFLYDKGFAELDYDYSVGSSQSEANYSYMSSEKRKEMIEVEREKYTPPYHIPKQVLPKNAKPRVAGCGVMFSGTLISDVPVEYWASAIWHEDQYSEITGCGSYPHNGQAFPKAVASTFDGLVVDSGTTVIIYSEPNFKGTVLLNITGPAVINNQLFADQMAYLKTKTYDDPYLQKTFPPSRRYWSKSNMQTWSTGSVKIICGKCGNQ